MERPQLMAIMPHYLPTIVSLTLNARLYSLLLAVHILAQLNPHAFVHLSAVEIIAHINIEDVEAVDMDGWAGMDQKLSVLLSLGVVRFINACNTAAHLEAGMEAIIERLPVLNVRKVLSFVAQKPSK